MSQAITLSTHSKDYSTPSSAKPQGSFNHHKVEDLTLKCEVGTKKLRREANLECAKAIGYCVLAGLVLTVIVLLAIKIAILAVGLLAISQASLLAVALRALIGATVGFAAGKIFLAPILIRSLEHQESAQNRFNLARIF